MEISELMEQKEEELQRVQKELDALRTVARMMREIEGNVVRATATPIFPIECVPLTSVCRAEEQEVDVACRQFP
jgi:hypothetical protein